MKSEIKEIYNRFLKENNDNPLLAINAAINAMLVANDMRTTTMLEALSLLIQEEMFRTYKAKNKGLELPKKG